MKGRGEGDVDDDAIFGVRDCVDNVLRAVVVDVVTFGMLLDSWLFNPVPPCLRAG